MTIPMPSAAAMRAVLGRAVASLARAHRRRREERRTAAMLRSLDDAALKDIGVTRCEILGLAHRPHAAPGWR